MVASALLVFVTGVFVRLGVASVVFATVVFATMVSAKVTLTHISCDAADIAISSFVADSPLYEYGSVFEMQQQQQRNASTVKMYDCSKSISSFGLSNA